MNYGTFSRALFTLGTPQLRWDQDFAGIASQQPLRFARVFVWRTNKGEVLPENMTVNSETPCSYLQLRHSGHIYPFPRNGFSTVLCGKE